jgi:hypothetical protein|tara:strand:+ start:41909 stop:43006 length:1098 start_codon:yes stop_codon:yes gene_type:complete
MPARKTLSLVLVSVLLIPIISPSVAGEWTDDGWLTNLIGPERMENGDEFGCHGFQGIDSIEENWVIEACKDYLVSHTNSSRWGKNPISFGIVGDYIDNKTANALLDSGFLITGDMIQSLPEGLTSFPRNGGTIEKNSANIQLLESAEEDSLVSIWWRARVDDIKVREDKDLISWLEDQEVWFTTWGEWYFHEISSSNIEVKVEENKIIISNPISSTEWDVPGSVTIDIDGNILEVYNEKGEQFPDISATERKLKQGWRTYESGAFFTLMPGTSVEVTVDKNLNNVSYRPLGTFNNLDYAVTIVGHHTTNLFQWSSDFQESILTFTWLVERPSEEEINWSLPLIALSVLIAVPIIVKRIVDMDEEE